MLWHYFAGVFPHFGDDCGRKGVKLEERGEPHKFAALMP